jgi:hypothetical protein
MVCNEAKNLNGMERFGQHDLSEIQLYNRLIGQLLVMVLKPSFINVEVN